MAQPKVREPIKLTPEQKQTLLNMEGDLAWLQAELDKAKRAGIADDALEARVKEMIAKRRGILNEYA